MVNETFMLNVSTEKNVSILVMVVCLDKKWCSKAQIWVIAVQRERGGGRHILEQKYLARHFRAPNASCLNVNM